VFHSKEGGLPKIEIRRTYVSTQKYISPRNDCANDEFSSVSVNLTDVRYTTAGKNPRNKNKGHQQCHVFFIKVLQCPILPLAG